MICTLDLVNSLLIYLGPRIRHHLIVVARVHLGHTHTKETNIVIVDIFRLSIVFTVYNGRYQQGGAKLSDLMCSMIQNLQQHNCFRL